ncbi:MAG: protein kinase [Kofleriaceae bacterium]
MSALEDGRSASPSDPLIGQTLGKDYRVLERIGVGGMGVVYLVEHTGLKKRFAAKVLSAELAANAEARARFQTEAHAASQLEHENIVTITDYGLTVDGRPYIVMEFLRGNTLDQRLLDGPLTLEEIVAIIIPVGRGLAEAHAEGIVHRDVKPENVFLTQRSGGRWGVKVLDFGIAKAPLGKSKLTKMGQALGSPMYMAPEACKGEEVDHRADIYSLGVLMYLLWCGRVPFEDDNVLKVLQMQVTDAVTPPSHWRHDLSLGIEAVILRALEKEPERRFLSMAEMIAALEAALPPGADRLLVEAARGTTSMRTITDGGFATPFPSVTTTGRMRIEPLATAPTRPSLELSAATPSPAVTTLTPTPAAPPRKRWWPLAAIALVGLGAGGAFLLSRSSEKAPAGSAAAASGAASPEPAGGVAPGPAVEPAPMPAAATVHVAIKTDPAGAEVFLGERSLGRTPLDVDVARATTGDTLRIEQAGYQAWSRPVELTSDLAVDATLVPDVVAETVESPPPAAKAGRRTGRKSGGAKPGSGSAPTPPPPTGTGPGSSPGLEIRTNR